MLLLSILALVLVVYLDGSHAFYYGRESEYERPHMCALPSKPCRLRVILADLGPEPEIASSNVIQTQTCTCSGTDVCSDDWSLRERVVSRKVISTNYNITLQMMFCRRVSPKRLCTRRNKDVSLVMKGSLAMPLDIDEYNCRCRRRQPLLLSERGIGEDHLTYHKYVCANHMRDCPQLRDPRGPRRVRCLTTGDIKTTYHCKCPPGTQCRVQQAAWEGGNSYGHCVP